MSKSIFARRIALLSSSSLGLVAVASAVSIGASLTPAVAAAQTVTCAPVTTGEGTAAVTYPAGTYNPGILCNYSGDGATVTTSGAVTVSSSGGVPADPLVNGVNLRASGADDIRWNSTAGTVTGGNQTNGPVIDAQTVSGNINVSTAGVTGSQATITHGIYAQSTGGGSITITSSGSVSGSNSTTGVAAIEAVSTGGNGDVTINAAGFSGGRLYGIRARASGTGDLTITTSGGSTANSATDIAVIDATTGTGLLTINATGTLGNSGGVRTGSALRFNAGGDANIAVSGLSSRAENNAVVDMTTAAGRNVVLTHGSMNTGIFGQNEANRFAIRSAGAGNVTINSNGDVIGRADFSAFSGTLNWNIASQWYSVGGTVFGSGSDTVQVTETGFLVLTQSETSDSGDTAALEAVQVLDFGAGEDTLVNRGILSLGARRQTCGGCRYSFQDHYESEIRFVGLETFENFGSIVMGQLARPGSALNGQPADTYYDETDGATDDVLILPGTSFVAGEGSRLVMDVRLTASQSACDVGLRNTAVSGSGFLDGSMPAADCVSIPGGSTQGVTNVLIRTAAQGDRSGPVRIVLVDVGGGTSAAGDFVLDPENVGYTADQGGYLDLGYFIMPLIYDPDTQQHALVGITGQNALQQGAWATAAHEVWRLSTGTWFDRQADLRGGRFDNLGGGVWLRLNGEVAKRDSVNSIVEGASTFTFDNSFEQGTFAVTGGLDLLKGGNDNGSTWVVGLTAGYTSSELNYEASPNVVQFDGWTGGAYASYLAGGLFVDGLVHANRLELIADVPGLNLSPEGTLLDTRLLSVGGRVEAGWRIPFGSGAFVEPLAGLSYVRTAWDEMNVPSDDLVREGVKVDFDDPTSLRASLGARLGVDQNYGSFRAQYSLLGRVSEEFEGEARLTLDTIVDDAFVSDSFTGRFSEFGVAASFYGLGETLSAFGQFGGKFGDDYEAQDVSVGVRVNW